MERWGLGRFSRVGQNRWGGAGTWAKEPIVAEGGREPSHMDKRISGERFAREDLVSAPPNESGRIARRQDH